MSRIFCEVMHDFRSDLLPTPEFVQVHQHVSNIIQHKAGSNVSFYVTIILEVANSPWAKVIIIRIIQGWKQP